VTVHAQDVLVGEVMAEYDGLAVAVSCAWENGLEAKWSHLSSWYSALGKDKRVVDYSDEHALCCLTFMGIVHHDLSMNTAPSVGILRNAFDEDDRCFFYKSLENHAAKTIQGQFRAFRFRSRLRATKRRGALDVQSVKRSRV
jgi:hypothetical protein